MHVAMAKPRISPPDSPTTRAVSGAAWKARRCSSTTSVTGPISGGPSGESWRASQTMSSTAPRSSSPAGRAATVPATDTEHLLRVLDLRLPYAFPGGGRRLLGADLVDHGVGDFAHRQAPVHGSLLDPPEGFGLGQAHLGHQQ